MLAAGVVAVPDYRRFSTHCSRCSRSSGNIDAELYCHCVATLALQPLMFELDRWKAGRGLSPVWSRGGGRPVARVGGARLVFTDDCHLDAGHAWLRHELVVRIR